MNVLLTSAGRRTYMVEYFKQILKGKGSVHASNSSFSPALNIADDFVITPFIYSEDYIPFLLQYVEDNNINVIISLFDIDLPILAKNIDLFKKIGAAVIVSNYEITQICNDKWKSYKFLKENKFNTPLTYIDYKEAKSDIANGILNFPVIVKPRWGMGSIGIFKALNKNELKVFFKKVKREIKDSYLQFESESNIDQAVIIQECIIGQEYGLDIFNDLNGKYLKTFVKKKIAMRSGETDISLTEDHNRFQELGKELSEKLGHIANLDSDWFLSKDKIYVLEMNCRFGGGYPFTHLAGANLPKVILDLLEFNNFSKEDLEIEYQLEMVKDIRPIKFNRK